MTTPAAPRTTGPTADVCVVGAGPAGLSAARALTLAGAKVVVIERHARPGAKACGGALTRGAFAEAGLDPGRVPAGGRLFSSLEVRGPLGARRLEQDWPTMMIIDREAWLAGRLAELRDLGCEVRLGARFLAFEDGIACQETSPRRQSPHPPAPFPAREGGDPFCSGPPFLAGRGVRGVGEHGRAGFLPRGPHEGRVRISLDRGELSCGALVGADGAASRVRRGLGLPLGLAVRAFQVTLPLTDPAAARLARRGPWVRFDPRRFRAGYGWVFPAADEVRIGAGASEAMLGKGELKRGFYAWLGRLGVDPAGRRLQAGTIGCGYLGHRFGRVVLAGDAAGLASPVTGEGLRQALISGREVARELTEPGYRSRIIADLATAHRRTHDALARPWLGSPLFALAPALLGLPGIERVALGRFAGAG